MVDEEWKEIKNYEGYYQISNFGRVKSLYRIVSGCDGRNTRIKGRILKLATDTKGYNFISLQKHHKTKKCKVHRLVGIYFINNPFNKPFINHIDGIKTNNHEDNLEWVTAHENQLHAYKNGLHPILCGIINGNSKLSENQVQKILQDDRSQRKIAKTYGISQSTVCQIKTRKTWKHI